MSNKEKLMHPMKKHLFLTKKVSIKHVKCILDRKPAIGIIRLVTANLGFMPFTVLVQKIRVK